MALDGKDKMVNIPKPINNNQISCSFGHAEIVFNQRDFLVYCPLCHCLNVLKMLRVIIERK